MPHRPITSVHFVRYADYSITGMWKKLCKMNDELKQCGLSTTYGKTLDFKLHQR